LSYDHDQLLRVFEGLFFTGLSCVVIVLAMVFVRKVFEATAVRMLFDVLVFLIWLMILWANSDVIVKGSAALSMEQQQGLMLTLPFTVALTVGAVLVASAVAVFLALRAHFRNAHKDQHLSDTQPPRK
jgi:ABC-type phosphate transport system permease subunit